MKTDIAKSADGNPILTAHQAAEQSLFRSRIYLETYTRHHLHPVAD
jgi:hypothetical protein